MSTTACRRARSSAAQAGPSPNRSNSEGARRRTRIELPIAPEEQMTEFDPYATLVTPHPTPESGHSMYSTSEPEAPRTESRVVTLPQAGITALELTTCAPERELPAACPRCP
jgi:hypothetical protein